MDITEYRLDQHDKQFDAHSAKMDRIEAAIGELRLSVARIEAGLAGVNASVAGLRATVILTGLASVALVVGVLAYGQAWFGIGAATREIVHATVLEMQHAAAPAKP